MRLNKEIKLESPSCMSIKFGTTNKDNPQVIYLVAKMWLKTNDIEDIDSRIKSCYRSFKRKLKYSLKENDLFDLRHILEFDVNSDKFVNEKKKFFEVTMLVRQKNECHKKLKELKGVVSTNFKYLFTELEEELLSEGFEITKTKH